MNQLRTSSPATLLLFWFLFFLGCKQKQPETPEQKGLYQVIAIKDGDTIEILKDGKPLRVRLQGVDCPEKKQDFGTKAQQFTADLVFGKMVALVVHDIDRYGRTVGEIILPDGRNLGYELVKHGFAWHYTDYSKDPELARLEAEARQEKVGLWQSPNPVAPWAFRKPKAKTAALPKTASSPSPSVSNKNGKAFVCNSTSSTTFHLDQDCHLLKRCKSGISTFTQAKAKNDNRKACKVCAA